MKRYGLAALIAAPFLWLAGWLANTSFFQWLWDLAGRITGT